MNLTDSVTSIPGVGSIMAGKLERLEIRSIFDLLYHLPFRYEDRRLISLARQVQVGESVVVVGIISAVQNIFTKNKKRLQTATITDASGKLAVIWFNQTYLARAIVPGSQVALFGKVEFFNAKPALISPEFEILSDNAESIHLRRLVPIYPSTEGLTSKWLRTKIYGLLQSSLPQEIIPEEQLVPWKQALTNMHFPHNLEDVDSARQRLAFDELLLLQLGALKRRQEWQKIVTTHALQIDEGKIKDFIAKLPFSLTASQIAAYAEILADLTSKVPMNRLLEGDVGSGKTVVAAIAAYATSLNSLQTLVMAPTQILATQHFNTLQSLFAPLNIKIGLVTGQKKDAVGQIIVGTHALLSDSLKLDKVGLIVIDEQHRFGVAQRALVASKTRSPHILTMTATPIPRTIALTMYADLQLSQLTELPSGRLPIKTWVIPESKREAAYEWIKDQITQKNAQVFVVCPFIDESETLTTVKAATVEFKKLQSVFSKQKLALLHGKMKSAEKDGIIAKFKTEDIDMLVSTPVVEVGMDIPGATIMLIEAADRFGLAALHQLRGRVGRNDKQAYCLLFADQNTSRLKFMEQYQSGLELAETDLRLRGAGDIFGTSQHGSHHFKVATYQDFDQIAAAREMAQKLLPTLKNHPVLLSLLNPGKIELIQPN